MQKTPCQADVKLASYHPVLVHAVSTRRELDLFIRLPRLLYKGMSGYTPPLDLEQTNLLSPEKAVFFGNATIQYFIAWRNARPVGRIAAIINPLTISLESNKIGFFGALDAEVDEDVVHALLATMRDWLSDKGMTHVRGPVTLNCHGESGIMISGQQQPPMVATPWHPHTLHPVIERAGLDKEMDLLSFKLDLQADRDLSTLFPKGLKLGHGRLGNISISALSRRKFASQGDVLRRLYNDAWAGTYNFVPMQPQEMRAMIAALRPVLRPEHYVQIDQDGEPVAMALVVPNIFDLAKDLGPRPSPMGWVKLAGRIMTHRCSSARVILLGVSRQVRGTFIGALLPTLAIAELLSRRDRLPYKFVELGWVLETNTSMLNLIRNIVPEPYKVHRMYGGDLSKLSHLQKCCHP